MCRVLNVQVKRVRKRAKLLPLIKKYKKKKKKKIDGGDQADEIKPDCKGEDSLTIPVSFHGFVICTWHCGQ